MSAEEEAYQVYIDANRRPQTMPAEASPTWLIRYADQNISDEVFGGESAEECARRRFDQQRQAWSISLFQEVARG